MAAPIWTTPPGNLGTIVEQEFYQVTLLANNADHYQHVSGKLPNGIRITTTGNVEGYPSSKDYIQGVPTEVASDLTSRFVVRATNTSENTVADRVFQLTITGNDAPTIDSLPPTDLGAAWDGSYFEQQLTAFDPDPGDVLTWKLQSGNLPAGLSVSTSGLISGFIEPAVTLTGTPGWDKNNYDIGTWDFSTLAESKTYEWVVEVTDGKEIAIKNYTLFVASRNTATADTDVLTADSFKDTANTSTLDSLVDASSSTERPPALLTKPTDFGTIKHDNFFAQQFTGYDPDGDDIEYSISVGAALGWDADGSNYDEDLWDRGEQELPPGLVLNTQTGWLTGYIPTLNITTKDYEFAIQVYKKDKPTIKSEFVYFTLTIEGDIDKNITWPESDLGTINTGDVSEIDLRATVRSGQPVQYELRSGSLAGTDGEGKLPQGLKITPDGYLQGRVSFEYMMFDTGATTFDVDMYNSGEFLDFTTFEQKFKFTVRAYSSDLVIDTYSTFTLEILPLTNDPYESLYIRALPDQTQRDIFSSLVNNSDDIPVEDIYRPTDFYFGLQKDIRALIATGLSPVEATKYVEATAKNHFNNTLKFGDIKVATSYDDNNTAKYDIVYVELKDSAMGIDPNTNNPAPASDTIKLQEQKSITNMFDFIKPMTADAGFPKTSTGNQHADQGNEIEVYPNAIQNMRNRMKTQVGSTILERFVLPDWMNDKQTSGEVLGWTLAAPIVYMKPGTGDRTAYRLKQRTETDLKKISFEVDRFILDNNLSNFYDKQNQKYSTTAETVFDQSETGSSVVATVDYSVAENIRFDDVNKHLASEIVASGAITGVTDVSELNGKTVIWLKHEGMSDFDNDNDGWNEILDLYDTDGFDHENDEQGRWDGINEIKGYADKLLGNATVNQQAGVWTISVGTDNIVTFTFTKEVNNGEQVKVTYDNITYFYERNASAGRSPMYIDAKNIYLSGAGTSSTFDGNDTRFFAGVDVHTERDTNDVWIKFPRLNAFRDNIQR